MLDIINLSFKLPLPEDHILLAWWRRTGPAMVGQKEIFISPVAVLVVLCTPGCGLERV